jgi:hypothetical protein
MTQCRLLLSLAVCAAAVLPRAHAEAQSFDGITIIEFADEAGETAIASGEYIVTFVSARGSYASVVPRKGTHGGCQSLALPGSYSGSSIAFGLPADSVVRKHRLQTYCPAFSLRFEDDGTMLIETREDPATGQKGFASRHKVIAHIPLRDIDFESAPFTQHDLKGIRLGPVLDPEGLNRLSAAGASHDRHKYFTRQVQSGAGKPIMVDGQAAAAEVTGWPWDILYFAQYIEELPQKSTYEAFEAAVIERYGQPSWVNEDSAYMLWAYDLDGTKLSFDAPGSNGCRATIDPWLRYDQLNRVLRLEWEFNPQDIGPWGCSVIMELMPDRGSGAVSGYGIRAANGYVWAINHFLQRVE